MTDTEPSNDDGAKAAYEAFAPVYDEFTEHHDYGLWLGNLMPVLERHGLQGRRLLDVACGTGNSFLLMLESGWTVTACDISPSMVERAQAKVPADSPVKVAVADMRDLPVFGEFDLVWCLDDAVNYLLTQVELERALAGMAANLSLDGILAFDLNTLHSFRTFFADEFVVEGTGRRMIWSGQGSELAGPGTIGEATFTVEPVDSRAERIPPQLHRERHFPEGVVLQAIEAAGLRPLVVYGHHYDAVFQQPLDEDRHTKAVYLARKGGTA
jgi:SAM-dependent methyltransferase